MKEGARQRSKKNRSSKALKRARLRYIGIVKAAITADHSLLWTTAVKMRQRGLYADATMLRDIRFYILRRMAYLAGCRYGTNDWSCWLLKNGWGKTWHDACKREAA